MLERDAGAHAEADSEQIADRGSSVHRAEAPAQETRPLEGLLVVEFGQSVAAPFAGQLLADLGARVVKVEKPTGDDARGWGPPFLDGVAATFQALNRGKTSVVCNLRDESQREKLVEYIVDNADVVIQNLRPTQVDQLGIGSTTLRLRKPRLIYCNMGSFGAVGPLASQPGYDPLMQAFGGIMSVTGEQDGASVRVGPSIIDVGTALWSVIGILAALQRRQTDGVGTTVDVSLFETSVSWMSLFAQQYLASGVLPKKRGTGQSGIAPYRAYATRDGEMMVATGNNSLFIRLCTVLGHPEWASDPQFATNADRVTNAEELDALIEPVVRTQETRCWLSDLSAAGVPCAPIHNVAEMLNHEQTLQLGLLRAVPPLSQPVVAPALSLDGIRPFATLAPPPLGNATAEVLGHAATGAEI